MYGRYSCIVYVCAVVGIMGACGQAKRKAFYLVCFVGMIMAFYVVGCYWESLQAELRMACHAFWVGPRGAV